MFYSFSINRVTLAKSTFCPNVSIHVQWTRYQFANSTLYNWTINCQWTNTTTAYQFTTAWDGHAWICRGIRQSRALIHAEKLEWRHNERYGVSNNQRLECFSKCWFRRSSNKAPNWNRNFDITIQENAFENVVYKMSTILPRLQCVNQRSPGVVSPFAFQLWASSTSYSNISLWAVCSCVYESRFLCGSFATSINTTDNCLNSG